MRRSSKDDLIISRIIIDPLFFPHLKLESALGQQKKGAQTLGR